MDHNADPETNRGLACPGPVDAFLGAVALAAPWVGEATTRDGSSIRYVLAGVAAIAGLTLVERLTNADRANQSEVPPHLLDSSGQL